jgi:hypothetical protein
MWAQFVVHMLNVLLLITHDLLFPALLWQLFQFVGAIKFLLRGFANLFGLWNLIVFHEGGYVKHIKLRTHFYVCCTYVSLTIRHSFRVLIDDQVEWGSVPQHFSFFIERFAIVIDDLIVYFQRLFKLIVVKMLVGRFELLFVVSIIGTGPCLGETRGSLLHD